MPVGATAAGGGDGPATTTREDSLSDPVVTSTPSERRTRGFATTSAASGNGSVRLREWGRYIDQPRRLLDAELSTANAAASASIDVPRNASSVTLVAYAADGDAVDLNVTDAAGRHVGYSPAIGGAVVGIPNATYSGVDSSPERVRIANASGRSLDVEAQFVPGVVESTSVTIYAVVTPDRPALLSVAPARVDLTAAPDAGDEASVTLAEVGDQRPVRDASVAVDRTTLTTPGGSPLPTGVAVRVAEDSADIEPDGRQQVPVSVSVDRSVDFDGLHTRFTGPLTVRTDNAGSVTGTVSVLLLNTSVGGASLLRANRSVTGVHLDARPTADLNVSSLPGSANAAYRTRVVGNGTATVALPTDGADRTAYVRTAPGQWRRIGPGARVDPVARVSAGDRVVVLVDPASTPFPTGVPGVASDRPPTDPDSDGVYEDIDGDGRIAFADVVALAFADFTAIESDSAGLSALDVNDNGRIDFDDVVELFEAV
jgi:PKD repeat protein